MPRRTSRSPKRLRHALQLQHRLAGHQIGPPVGPRSARVGGVSPPAGVPPREVFACSRAISTVDQSGQRDRHRQEHQRAEDQGGAVEEVRLHVLPGLDDLDEAEHADQRGVLHQGDVVVQQRRDHLADGLRDDHLPHRLAVVHPQRAGGLHLALGDRLDPRPVDLGHVGPVGDGQRDHPVPERRGLAEPGREPDLARDRAVGLGGAEEAGDQEQHQQQGNAAEAVDVGDRQPPHRGEGLAREAGAGRRAPVPRSGTGSRRRSRASG